MLVFCVPFFSIISYGLGSNGVVNLFCLSCCTNTVSPVRNFDRLAFLLLSAYTFILSLAFLSACFALTWLSSVSVLIGDLGNLIFVSRP